jgi:transketolase
VENPFNFKPHELEIMAYKIRVDLIKALANAGSGHSGGPLGLAELITTVYFYGAGIDPNNPKADDRDRIVFSAGHYSPVIYATLAQAGYFSIEHFIHDYRQFGGDLDGHPNFHTPGIENASGPLAQGTSQAAGMAAAAKLDKKDWRVWLFMSDGEQQEGQTQEAAMWIASRKLDNVIAILDANNMQIDGNVSDILAENWVPNNYKNYGWHVIEINGNNVLEIIKAIDEAKKVKGKPTLIFAKTTPGKGVSFMENNYLWHGEPPKGEQVTQALKELRGQLKKMEVDYV